MWVLAAMIYLLVITIIFFSWTAREQAKDDALPVRRSAPAQGATRP
jgi:hypothetical protein